MEKVSKVSSNNCFFSLAYSIGTLGLACGSISSLNFTVERVSLQRGLLLTCLGFVHFISLTRFCDRYFLETKHGHKFIQKYQLMVSDVMEITNKLVSAIQAAYSFIVGLLVCKSTCSNSFVHASHVFMEAYAWFGTAYFMYDIWSMYKVHAQTIAEKLSINHAPRVKDAIPKHDDGSDATNCYQRKHTTSRTVVNNSDNNNVMPAGNGLKSFFQSQSTTMEFMKYCITHPVIIFHHIFIATFGLVVVTYIRGGGHCIYSYMFMMELSTPFVSLRSILSTMRLKKSRLYVVNGLTMIAIFFVVRVCIWPYVMWLYSRAINVSLWQAMINLPIGCQISILILFLPQVYWFYLMFRGALKVLMPNESVNSTKIINNNHHMPPGDCIPLANGTGALH